MNRSPYNGTFAVALPGTRPASWCLMRPPQRCLQSITRCSPEAVGASDLSLNAPWLRAVVKLYPSTVPTAFLLADGFVALLDRAGPAARWLSRLAGSTGEGQPGSLGSGLILAALAARCLPRPRRSSLGLLGSAFRRSSPSLAAGCCCCSWPCRRQAARRPWLSICLCADGRFKLHMWPSPPAADGRRLRRFFACALINMALPHFFGF